MATDRTAIQRPQRWDVPYAMENDDGAPPSDAELERLLATPPFREIDPSGFRRTTPFEDILRNDTRIRKYRDGDIIVRQGGWGSSAFFVLSGTARVVIEPPDSPFVERVLGQAPSKRRNWWQAIAQLWRNHSEPEYRSRASRQSSADLNERAQSGGSRIYIQDVAAVVDEYRTATIEEGHWFGEQAALGRTPRTATVVADGDAELLEIRWQGLRDILRFDREGSLKRYIEEAFRERSLFNFLNTEPVFQSLSKEQLNELVAHAEFASFGEYDSAQPYREQARNASGRSWEAEPVIAREGDYPNGIVLIRNGLARISRRHYEGERTVSYLCPGQAFGLDEIGEGLKTSSSVPLRNSLRAMGFVSVVIIPTALAEKYLLLDIKEKPNEPTVIQNAPSTELDLGEPLTEFLVGNRYVQGTASMVIDLDRCTRCDDCVRACAVAHDNNPRFVRHGPTHDHFMVAGACMHCTDPVCMIECPTGAIQRDLDLGRVTIDDRTCIGCTQCAGNCPYNAIRMVSIRDSRGLSIVDTKSGKPVLQAAKCDLCIDQRTGPACVAACPHDALVRLDMRNLQEVGEYFSR